MSADIAVVGMGVMGTSLARNFQSRGQTVAIFDLRPERRAEVIAAHDAKGDPGRLIEAADWGGLIDAFEGPAKIVLMITAGKAVDSVLDALEPELAKRPLPEGDQHVVIDAGNSHYADTERRVSRSEVAGYRFMGMGVSGGEKGALEGPSMMPGGDEGGWLALKSLLEPAAAVSDSGPCVTWCGRGPAGHYVKMVHNGIEYGDMQLISEVYTLMSAMGHSPRQMADTFTRWNEGALASYLIEITSQIVAARDPEGDGPLVDQILDVAGQKGTGRWTSITAVEQGVPLPTVTAAVDARALSAIKPLRVQAEAAFAPIRETPELSEEALEGALYAAKLMSYTQGFSLLRTASEARGFGTDLAEVARIWKAGCIIRAAFLDRVYAAFKADPDLPLLILAPDFAEDVRTRMGALRAVVAEAVRCGLPVPALSASLAWFDTLSTARGSARLIQAQRDFFGAHTYRRIADPDTAVHSDWEGLEQL